MMFPQAGRRKALAVRLCPGVRMLPPRRPAVPPRLFSAIRRSPVVAVDIPRPESYLASAFPRLAGPPATAAPFLQPL